MTANRVTSSTKLHHVQSPTQYVQKPTHDVRVLIMDGLDTSSRFTAVSIIIQDLQVNFSFCCVCYRRIQILIV